VPNDQEESMTSRLTTRLAALGAAGLIASLGAVATTGTAQAAAPSGDYTCATALGDQAVTVTPTTKLPKKAKAGKEVPATKVTMKVVLSQELVDGLRYLGVTSLSGEATGAKIKVGTTSVALDDVAFKDTKVPSSGTMTVKAVGKTAAFTPKKAGALKIVAPKKFDFSSANQDGQPLTDDAPCSSDGKPATIGTLTVK
jgi:hypothetical protein